MTKTPACDPNAAAFARPAAVVDDDKGHYLGQAGLTKREYFAAQAMAGFLSDSSVTNLEMAAREAVMSADLLIFALNAGADDANGD